jgi:hypothetical protein
MMTIIGGNDSPDVSAGLMPFFSHRAFPRGAALSHCVLVTSRRI